MSPRSRSERSRGREASRVQILVFCEGLKTEERYLSFWHRYYRDRAIVKIARHEHTSPFELVRAAATQRSVDLREARRGRGDPYDQYWCVFDVDEHPKLPEALETARANDIKVALSGPCIELWFVIHFDRQTAFIERDRAQARSRQMLGCGKDLTDAALHRLRERHDRARDHALLLERMHRGNGSSHPWNPHSDVWRLVDTIRGDPP